MKHILEKRVLFYGVIVRTFWMTLVHMSICKHACIRTYMQTDRQTFFYFIFILYVQDHILNGQDNILFIPDQAIKN